MDGIAEWIRDVVYGGTERIVAARAVQTGPKPKIVRLGHPARLSSQVSQALVLRKKAP
jgi:hypothetical protein